MTSLLRCHSDDARPLGARLLEAVRENGYGLARTSGLADRQLFALAHRFGALWDPKFRMQTVRYDAAFAGRAVAFDRKGLAPHCECAYDTKPPRYVVLYCRAASRVGGLFFLVPMGDVLAHLRAADRLALRTTEYSMESPRNGITAKRPLLARVHGVGDVLLLTPMPPPGTKVIYQLPASSGRGAKSLLRRVADVAADPALRLTHRWRPGDVIVVDNTRFLHGREGFEGTGRHLKHLRIGRFTVHGPN